MEIAKNKNKKKKKKEKKNQIFLPNYNRFF